VQSKVFVYPRTASRNKMVVHQYFEHRRRWVRRAIQNLPASRVPSRGSEQTPRPSSDSCLENRQTITLGKHAVFDPDQLLLDNEGPDSVVSNCNGVRSPKEDLGSRSHLRSWPRMQLTFLRV
jgi:hypothetical protein